MQQGGGGGGGSQFRPPAPAPAPELQVPSVNGATIHGAGADAYEAFSAAAGEDVGGVGGGGGGGVSAANRWPRQETLALLKIRSDMDGVFRDATLKAPLWEEISRKLGELGYVRSSKKCKEKFENVQKYYKRTKEGRSRRQDGKSYRFFTELEALAGGSRAAGLAAALSSPPPIAAAPTAYAPPPPPPLAIPISTAAPVGVNISSNTSTSVSNSDDDDEDTEEVGVAVDGAAADVGSRKRKRDIGGGSWKMIEFFEGMMKTVMERQEAMQQKFLDALERRERDLAVREEAWKLQEAAQLSREHELVAKERAVAASRDAAIISFLQKLGGGSGGGPIQLSPPPPPVAIPPPQTPPPPPVVVFSQPNSTPLPANSAPSTTTTKTQMKRLRPSTDIVVFQHPVAPSAGFESPSSSPSRWPKAEVHALIQLRTGLESRYKETGPKAPLWEEISSEMRRLGYGRSPKRCKEKWENINKYFKKVKDNTKKRPDDAKTCPYYHQLEALYRKKLVSGNGIGGSFAEDKRKEALMAPPKAAASLQEKAPADVLTIMPPPQQLPSQTHAKINPGFGGLPASFFNGVRDAAARKELTEEDEEHHRNAPVGDYDDNPDDYDEHYSDDMDDEVDDGEEDDDEGGKMKYEIQYQRPNLGGGETMEPSKATAAAAGSSSLFPAIVR